MKNCIVGQSGGPTAVINSSLAGVIKACLNTPEIGEILGAVNGVEGIINDNFVHLEKTFNNETNYKYLMQTPASYLGSCRVKLPKAEENPQIYEKIFSMFENHNVGYFFYIGGNDSMDTVDKLNDYAKAHEIDVRIMGVPKTVDNDLPVTDHTPGFGSAAKYIAATVREAALDASVYDLKSVLIIEMMGRNAGWLTAASALARTNGLSAPHLIYLPENPFSLEEFLNDVREKIEKYTSVVVCVSEGIKFEDGTYVCETTSSGLTDVFNHKNLSGTAKFLENAVRENIGCKARGVELNVCQRCAAHMLSKNDVLEAERIGYDAVIYAIAGISGEMMIFNRVSNTPYTLKTASVPIKEAANLEKIIPSDWITKNDVTQKMIDYLTPLIQGEPKIVYDRGLPIYIHR